MLFVPWAQADLDAYAEKARARFARMGVALRSIHEFESDAAKRAAVRARPPRSSSAAATRSSSSRRCRRTPRSSRSCARVNAGLLLYIGSSAGTNAACPTIRNTNDMPIVWPDGLAGLGFVPFQVNTHYIDREREVPRSDAALELGDGLRQFRSPALTGAAPHGRDAREAARRVLREQRAPARRAARGQRDPRRGRAGDAPRPHEEVAAGHGDGALLRSADGGARELRPGERLDALIPTAGERGRGRRREGVGARMLDTAESTRAHESDGAVVRLAESSRAVAKSWSSELSSAKDSRRNCLKSGRCRLWQRRRSHLDGRRGAAVVPPATSPAINPQRRRRHWRARFGIPARAASPRASTSSPPRARAGRGLRRYELLEFHLHAGDAAERFEHCDRWEAEDAARRHSVVPLTAPAFAVLVDPRAGLILRERRRGAFHGRDIVVVARQADVSMTLRFSSANTSASRTLWGSWCAGPVNLLLHLAGPIHRRQFCAWTKAPPSALAVGIRSFG